MGKMIFRKPEAANIRGKCVLCGKNPQKTIPGGKFKALCSGCDRRRFSGERWKERRKEYNKRKIQPYRKFVDTVCIRCGFVAEDLCQLDVDHIDGDHSNNNLNNLQTLCANCHRLKSKQEQLTKYCLSKA